MLATGSARLASHAGQNARELTIWREEKVEDRNIPAHAVFFVRRDRAAIASDPAGWGGNSHRDRRARSKWAREKLYIGNFMLQLRNDCGK